MTDISLSQPRARRPRPKLITLTDRAAERVRAILDKGDKPYVGLRVGVKNGGWWSRTRVCASWLNPRPFCS